MDIIILLKGVSVIDNVMALETVEKITKYFQKEFLSEFLELYNEIIEEFINYLFEKEIKYEV